MEFGWYEVMMLLLVLFAHLHGIYEGRKGARVEGIEACLKMLEDQKIINVAEDGEITAICQDK
jgi:hypothetical protein